METADDFLAHYGVAGMKWGRRKQEAINQSQSAARSAGNVAGKLYGGAQTAGKSVKRVVTSDKFKRGVLKAAPVAVIAGQTVVAALILKQSRENNRIRTNKIVSEQAYEVGRAFLENDKSPWDKTILNSMVADLANGDLFGKH